MLFRSIDMWSFGCILAEFYAGAPIFPGENELEQMSMIMEVNGIPPMDLLKRSQRNHIFFDKEMSPYLIKGENGKVRIPGSRNIEYILNCSDTAFINFVKECLIWDPEKRMTPEAARLHPWLSSNYNSIKFGLSRNNCFVATSKHSLDSHKVKNTLIGKPMFISNTFKTFQEEDVPQKPIFKKESKDILRNIRQKKSQKSFVNTKRGNPENVNESLNVTMKLASQRINKK